MDRDELKEILSDTEFVNQLLNFETGREVKRALLKKGIKLSDDNLDEFAAILADELESRIKLKELDSIESIPISGGISNQEPANADLPCTWDMDLSSHLNQNSWILSHIKKD